MTDLLVVFVTVADEATAGRIARTIVEERLAACVNVVPAVRSIYRWQGAIEEAGEALLVIKTARDRLDGLKVRVREIHPYDLPEVIAVPVEDGLQEYLDWALEEVRGGETKERREDGTAGPPQGRGP